MSSLLATTAPAVEIIAHRGASYDAPENTVASLRLGYQQGADAGEVDVHLTGDNRIVVLHDDDTGRVSGVTNSAARTSLEELCKLPAGQWGKWKGSPFAENIPSLADVLKVVPDGKRIFIEIKCGPEILPELERTLKASDLKTKQIVIIGFSYDTMVEARARFPHLRIFWLAGADRNKTYPPVEELIAKARVAKLDGLNLEQGFPINREFGEQIRKVGLKLYAWTVDDPVVARRLAEAGVDGVTTNRPKWLREQLTAAAHYCPPGPDSLSHRLTDGLVRGSTADRP